MHLTPGLNDPQLEPTTILPPSTLDELHAFFRELWDTPLTPTILKQTGVHRALLEIAEPGGGWPEGLSRRAESALAKWESFVTDVTQDGVWGPGGQMAGCVMVKGVEELKMMKMAGIEDAGAVGGEWWAVENPKAEDVALQTGHVGFEVGA